MCRWVIYYGDSILLADLLIQPNNSLLKQSVPQREIYTPLADKESTYDAIKHALRNHVTNGDGYGFAWYRRDLEKMSSSCFKSTLPAWNDRNMIELCEGIKSDLIMGHIRAASPGSVISRENCHPFKVGRYTFMHNGAVAGFSQVRRKLRAQLREDIDAEIFGTSDSELCFALFLNQLENTTALLEPEEVGEALHKTIKIIIDATQEVGAGASSLNFALSDGFAVFASRFRNCGIESPPALYLAHGSCFRLHKGDFHMSSEGEKDTILISSEPLSKCPAEWKLIPANHYIVAYGKNHPFHHHHHDDLKNTMRSTGSGHGEIQVTEHPIQTSMVTM